MNYGQRFTTMYTKEVARPSLQKNKCRKAKWLSEEALQTAVKRREGKKQRRKGKICPF